MSGSEQNEARMDLSGFRLGVIGVCLVANVAMACAWAMGVMSAELGLKIAGFAGAAGLWVLPDAVGVKGETNEGEGKANG